MTAPKRGDAVLVRAVCSTLDPPPDPWRVVNIVAADDVVERIYEGGARDAR